MKKIMATACCMIAGLVVFSQYDQNPPREIQQSFQREYPQSTPMEWQHSGREWHATFDDRDHNNGESTAHFDERGRHVDTHIPYDENDVPNPIRDNIQRRYEGADNFEYNRIDRGYDRPIFRIRLTHRNRRRTIYMDGEGRSREYQDRHW